MSTRHVNLKMVLQVRLFLNPGHLDWRKTWSGEVPQTFRVDLAQVKNRVFWATNFKPANKTWYTPSRLTSAHGCIFFLIAGAQIKQNKPIEWPPEVTPEGVWFCCRLELRRLPTAYRDFGQNGPNGQKGAKKGVPPDKTRFFTEPGLHISKSSRDLTGPRFSPIQMTQIEGKPHWRTISILTCVKSLGSGVPKIPWMQENYPGRKNLPPFFQCKIEILVGK